MRLTSTVVASLLPALSFGSPLEIFRAEKRQATSPYVFTGATGGVQPRLEIRDLQKTGEMWNLYLLAMTDFQAMDQSKVDSWFQIAGIHGMPWQDWDGVSGGSGEGQNTLGYCTHNQLLFATWHRPYLMLFEQQLQKVATNIAGKFPTSTRAKYQDAASKLRMPYWDWAKALPTSQPVVPTALSDEKVQVTKPDGTVGQIDNPLFDYNFHPLDHSQINGTGCPPGRGDIGSPDVCNNFNHTIRASFTFNDNAGLDSKLRDILSSLRSTLYKILSQYQAFDHFANNGQCGPIGGGLSNNLEQLHGNIHLKNYPGHMSPAAVTAFDPMFWMHHANVDRQLALFQALYPDTYMESCNADTPTWTILAGDPLDASSPLKPFHKNSAGAFWTSADVRNISKLSYTYPELVGSPSNATLVASIKKQYSGPADVPVSASKHRRQDAGPTTKELYLAQVTYPVYGLDNEVGGSSPYEVSVFVGDVPNDPKDWIKTSAGSVGAIGGMIQNDQISTGSIDLSDALKKAISSGATTEEKAVEYLKANLHYRLGLGDFEISKDNVHGISMKLVSTKVEIAQSDDVFDRWVGGFIEHGEVGA
ncbi:Di-copper centre-containing protein [Polyplosphaeria fusca]|uniref:tyrosinase n=1 Tax=Polyplosphaeria fusca TaxID=682080 RepID=A0A9P4UZ88_9PLEO|nr:Di-copper centre-containing protein [Polyplosphaeria fusca]